MKLTMINFAVLFLTSALVKSSQGTNFIYDINLKLREFHKNSTFHEINQKLDHFNSSNNERWNMRYLVNDQLFRDGGPIFIILGGETKTMHIELNGRGHGHIYDMAKSNKAYLIHTEHRYYGQNPPTKQVSSYLNVRQSLADVAHLVKYIKENTPKLASSKVIMFGKSYAGSMVVWFKRLYPNLIDGGWASGAPLLAKAQYSDYQRSIARIIKRTGGQLCYNRIRNGLAELQTLFFTNRSVEAKKILGTSNDFDERNKLDVWAAFEGILEIFYDMAKRNRENIIRGICNTLLDFDNDLSALKYFLKMFNSIGSGLKSTYKDRILEIKDYNRSSGKLEWYYQACNEFGWFPTSGSSNQTFGVELPFDFYVQMCSDLFGKIYTNSFIRENVNRTNHLLGGLSQKVDNIFITYGEIDPMRNVGFKPEDGAHIISDAFCDEDFNSINPADSNELYSVKTKIAALVKKWSEKPQDIKPSNGFGLDQILHALRSREHVDIFNYI